MFNKHDLRRDAFMLYGRQSGCGYDWWWHSLTGINAETGEEKAFFFEFFTCNPALGGDKPILGQSAENRKNGVKPSYMMVKAGAWGNDAVQLHRFFGWSEVELGRGVPFHIGAADCYLSETDTHGHISVSKEEAERTELMSDFGEMSWDLKIDKITAFNVGYGASGALRRSQLFEMFWHAEGMLTRFSGDIFLNGIHYIVTPDTCYGYADKNWGKNYTSPWVWLSSNNLTSRLTGKRLKDSVFDIGGGRPKIGCVALSRKLLSAYWHEGKGYEFNFSKLWTFTRTKFDCHETEDEIIWHVEQKNLRCRMVTDVSCKKCDMLLVNYEAPDGTKRHNRLWNGGNGVGVVRLYRGKTLIDEVDATNIGCEYGEYDN